MELDKDLFTNVSMVEFSCAEDADCDEVITPKECQELLGGFNLSDQKVAKIKNVMIGLANGVVGLYLDNFE